MSDENDITIVDSHGNTIKSKKENSLKGLLKNNLWNILGIGIPTVISVVGIINFIISKSYASSCANFYGVDKKYFNGTEMFEDKLIFLICTTVLFAYPFAFAYTNKKTNNKIYVVVTFIMTIIILFVQNILYTANLIEFISLNWLKGLIDNYVTIIMFLIADIVIAYFIIIRKFFGENKKYGKIEEVIFTIALLLYISSLVVEIAIRMSYKISDKKTYEIIEQNKAIISSYDGKFVVMDCEVQDEIIILKKGTYSIEEMTGVPITYHEYQKVVCE